MTLTGHIHHRSFYPPGAHSGIRTTLPHAPERPPEAARSRLAVHDGLARRPLWREIALVGALLGFYDAGRIVASHNVGRAHSHAHTVLSVERWMHLPREQSLQSLVLRSADLTKCANWYYAHIHFPLTGAVLVWLWFRRPVHYLWARRALAVTTTAGLVIIAAIPTAPPRMMGDGFVDTAQLYGQSVYGSVKSDKLANQFAAMPSLHVGWAVLIAVVCIKASANRLRWLWIMHPVLTVLVVVSTANHYWLDGMVGALLSTTALYLNRNSLHATGPQSRAKPDGNPRVKKPRLESTQSIPVGTG